jgi:hypothetical protein
MLMRESKWLTIKSAAEIVNYDTIEVDLGLKRESNRKNQYQYFDFDSENQFQMNEFVEL